MAVTHVNTGALAASASGTITPTIPAHVADDILAFHVTDGTSGGVNLSTATPAGWTLSIRNERNAAHEAVVYLKRATGAGTTVTVTALADDIYGQVSVVRGASTGALEDVTSVGNTAAAPGANPMSGTAITTVTDGAMAMAFFSTSDDNTLGNPAAGWTAAASGAGYDSTTGGDASHGVIYKVVSPAGTSGTPQMDQTNAGTRFDGYIVQTLAFRPASTGVGTPRNVGPRRQNLRLR